MSTLLGYSADDAMVDAFRPTAFWEATKVDIDDPAAELNWWLYELVGHVIEVEKLDDYFGEARKVPAMYDLASGDFLRSDKPAVGIASWNTAEEYLSNEGACAPSWQAVPFPGVSLVRIPRASFSGELVIEKRLIASTETSAEQVARKLHSPIHCVADSRPDPFATTSKSSAELLLFTDVRLVIGPLSHTGRLGPLLERRSFVRLKIGDRDRPLSFPYSLTPLAVHDDEDSEVCEFLGSVAAKLDNGWHRVTGFGPKSWIGDSEFSSDFGRWLDASLWFKPPIGNQGGLEFAWYMEPVEGATVRQLMQLFANRTGEALFDLDGPSPRQTEIRFVECPELETALHTGAIEKALRSDCHRLKAKLENRIQEHKVTCEREGAALLARWRKDSAASQESEL